jgi:ATP-binding cassette subfamily B protein
LIALWLKLLADGFTNHTDRDASSPRSGWLRRRRDVVPAQSCSTGAARVRDKIVGGARGARRDVAGVGRDDRAPRAPEYLDRLSVLRESGVRARPSVHVAVLDGRVDRAARDHLVLLVERDTAAPAAPVFALPIVITATWRPGVERRVEESVSAHDRLARGMFVLGTTPRRAKSCESSGLGEQLQRERRESCGPVVPPMAHHAA